MSSTPDNGCAICHMKIDRKGTNVAVFDCGHRFHLSCVLKGKNVYRTGCPTCSMVQNLNLKPNLGDDRKIAIASNTQARIKRRQMKPKVEPSWFQKLLAAFSPFASTPETMTEYIKAGYKLGDLQKMGFTPDDTVQEKIPWNYLRSKAKVSQLLQFGFKWKDMVAMGIRPHDLKDFNWSQTKHSLNLNANELLKLNMNLSELADLQYTPHQLNDLGFNWETFVAMGADVSTIPAFKMSIEDIKTYFNPNMSQWMAAGFYDKKRLTQNGWNVDEIIATLPALTQRADGRQLRLTF